MLDGLLVELLDEFLFGQFCSSAPSRLPRTVCALIRTDSLAGSFEELRKLNGGSILTAGRIGSSPCSSHYSLIFSQFLTNRIVVCRTFSAAKENLPDDRRSNRHEENFLTLSISTDLIL